MLASSYRSTQNQVWAGMAKETVSRILSDFTSEKLILKKGRLIQILDLSRLANMKN